MQDDIIFSVKIKRKLRERLRVYSIRKRTTIREIIPVIIEKFLKGKEK